MIDRSCAMQMRFDGTTMATGATDPEGRWGAVVSALTDAGMDRTIAGWSMVFSPEDPTMCALTGELALYPDPGSGEMIPDVLGATGASPFEVCAGGTSEVPLEGALGVVNGSFDVGAIAPPLVLIIAAGAPGCGSTALTLEESAAGTPYDLAVLALAPDATAEPLLQALVLPDEAGARASYFTAATAAEVSTRLSEILDARQDCVVDLYDNDEVLIENPDELNVFVDGELVPPDPDEGWVTGIDGSIAFNGAVCERMIAGEVLRVDASLGCDENVCVPIDPDEEGQGYETCDGLDNDCDDAVDEACE